MVEKCTGIAAGHHWGGAWTIYLSAYQSASFPVWDIRFIALYGVLTIVSTIKSLELLLSRLLLYNIFLTTEES